VTERATSENNDSGSPLEGHLGELRARLILILLSLVLASSLGFVLTPHILNNLQTLAPQGTTFFALRPGEVFSVYLKVSLYSGFLLALPFVLYQIRAFLKPALTAKEKQIMEICLWGGIALFICGIIFAYFILLKPVLAFLLNFGVKFGLVTAQYSIEHFVNLVLGLILSAGIAFEMPVLIFVLACLGLVNSRQLIGYWRQVIFACFALAACLTPTPDPLNMSLLGLALSTLYLLSVWVIHLARR